MPALCISKSGYIRYIWEVVLCRCASASDKLKVWTQFTRLKDYVCEPGDKQLESILFLVPS